MYNEIQGLRKRFHNFKLLLIVIWWLLVAGELLTFSLLRLLAEHFP